MKKSQNFEGQLIFLNFIYSHFFSSSSVRVPGTIWVLFLHFIFYYFLDLDLHSPYESGSRRPPIIAEAELWIQIHRFRSRSWILVQFESGSGGGKNVKKIVEICFLPFNKILFKNSVNQLIFVIRVILKIKPKICYGTCFAGNILFISRRNFSNGTGRNLLKLSL